MLIEISVYINKRSIKKDDIDQNATPPISRLRRCLISQRLEIPSACFYNANGDTWLMSKTEIVKVK